MAAKSKSAPKTTKALAERIEDASHTVQEQVQKAEEATIAAVGRVEETMASVKAGLDKAKAIGADVLNVVDNAGRTTLGGMVTMNSSLVSYGKDVFADTVTVGKQTLEAKSLKDVVDVQTAFAERRINAAFEAMSTMHALAQQNVLAVWAPFANLVRETSGQVDAAVPAMQVKRRRAA